MKAIKKAMLFLAIALGFALFNPLTGKAENPLRITGILHHVVPIGTTIDYRKGLHIVGEGAEKYTVEDIIVDDHLVNLHRVGTYPVTYFLRRTDVYAKGYVVVIDPNQQGGDIPTIEGARDFDVVLGNPPKDLLRETVAYAGHMDLTPFILIDDSGVNYDQVGEYPLYYYVTHTNGQVAIDVVKVRVIERDEEPPLLIGLKDLTVDVHQSVDLMKGVQARDNVSGLLTDRIEIDDSALNLNKLGTYPVTYSVQDEAGNRVQETVTVTVVDRTPPTIKVKKDLRFKVGSTPQYHDFFTIQDNYDDFSELEIIIDTSKVDIFSVGSYELIVTVKDRQNNVATERFLIYVYYSADTIWTNPFLIGAITSTVTSFVINLGLYLFLKRKTRPLDWS